MKEKFNRVLTIFSERLTYRHWVVQAGLVSGILGLLVFAGLSTKENNDNYVPIDTVQVVVAKQDIAPKTIIKESMVELREVPTSMVADDTVKDIGDIVDKPAKVDGYKNGWLYGRDSSGVPGYQYRYYRYYRSSRFC